MAAAAEDDADEAGDKDGDASAVSAPTPGTAASGQGVIAAAKARVLSEQRQGITRMRSPTPPRSLFRSTTGKGVAFTDEDVTFLIRLLEYKKYVARIYHALFPPDAS